MWLSSYPLFPFIIERFLFRFSSYSSVSWDERWVFVMEEQNVLVLDANISLANPFGEQASAMLLTAAVNPRCFLYPWFLLFSHTAAAVKVLTDWKLRNQIWSHYLIQNHCYHTHTHTLPSLRAFCSLIVAVDVSLVFYRQVMAPKGIRQRKCFVSLQVLNAQKAGYKAAIVHNVDSDDLISMGSNDRKLPRIPPPPYTSTH